MSHVALREVFGQATKRSGKRRTRQELQGALTALRPGNVRTLARFSGQTLDELDATFELLPIGTRLALDRAGALQLLDDEGGARFGVKALPVSVELVQLAAEQTLSIVPADILASRQHRPVRFRSAAGACGSAGALGPVPGR